MSMSVLARIEVQTCVCVCAPCELSECLCPSAKTFKEKICAVCVSMCVWNGGLQRSLCG